MEPNVSMEQTLQKKIVPRQIKGQGIHCRDIFQKQISLFYENPAIGDFGKS